MPFPKAIFATPSATPPKPTDHAARIFPSAIRSLTNVKFSFNCAVSGIQFSCGV